MPMTMQPKSQAADRAAAPLPSLDARAILSIKRLSDPQLHPDGSRVVFTVQEADFTDSRWTTHLWLTEWLSPQGNVESCMDDIPGGAAMREEMQPDRDFELEPDQGDDEGAQPGPAELTRQLTFSHEGECDPRWSPDGRWLAFLSTRCDPTQSDEEDEDEEPRYQIWVLPLDGGEARCITDETEGIIDYAWTNDSEHFVYLTPQPRAAPLESLARARESRKADVWLEHGEPRLRLFRRTHIEEKRPELLFAVGFGVDRFAISPDGERIAYLTNYTGDENDYHIDDLYLRHIGQQKTVKLVRRAGGKYRLRWSPNGRRIALISWYDPDLSYSREAVYCVDALDDDDFDALAPDSGLLCSDRDPSTEGDIDLATAIRSADRRMARPGVREAALLTPYDRDVIAYEWWDNDTIVALFACGAYDRLMRCTQHSCEAMPAAASAVRSSLAVHSEAGVAVYVKETSSLFPEIVLCDQEGNEHPLTALNTAFVDSHRLPRQELIVWRGADGAEIEGVLTYPIDYSAGRAYPMVVQLHGGPKGRATDTMLDYPMPPIWASEGYLVLRPNYRGSEGYGHAFAIANRRDLGGKDFEDVMTGVDHCIELGLADPDKLGILGGSYGGFLTNWAIGHTDRFRAAISLFGIFSLTTDYSNSRLSRWEHEYLGAYYWEDPELYRRLSPSAYLQNIRTPTLILHGDEDDNTSISNSREMYRALRQLGVAVQFVSYPREGHGIQEPNHRLDEMRRALAWMDRYVLGQGTQAVYRLGDTSVSLCGRFRLCIENLEAISPIGRPDAGDKSREALYLEATLAIARIEPDSQAPRLVFCLDRILLERSDGAIYPLAAIPVDAAGGKVLVHGAAMRLEQHASRESGEQAFGVAAVFRLPAKAGEGLLRIADDAFAGESIVFPAYRVIWSAEEPDEPHEGALGADSHAVFRD